MSYQQQIVGTETCKNLETWCDNVNPDCQVKYVKEKCEKYCGLCPGTLKYFYSIIPKIYWFKLGD